MLGAADTDGYADREADALAVAAALGDALGEGYSALQARASAASIFSASVVPMT